MQSNKSVFQGKLKKINLLIERIERLNLISSDLMNKNSIQTHSLKQDLVDEVKFACYEMQIIKIHILFSEKENSLLSLVNYINSNRIKLGVDEKSSKELFETYYKFKDTNKIQIDKIKNLRDRLFAHLDNNIDNLGNIDLNMIFNSVISKIIDETKRIANKVEKFVKI